MLFNRQCTHTHTLSLLFIEDKNETLSHHFTLPLLFTPKPHIYRKNSTNQLDQQEKEEEEEAVARLTFCSKSF